MNQGQIEDMQYHRQVEEVLVAPQDTDDQRRDACNATQTWSSP